MPKLLLAVYPANDGVQVAPLTKTSPSSTRPTSPFPRRRSSPAVDECARRRRCSRAQDNDDSGAPLQDVLAHCVESAPSEELGVEQHAFDDRACTSSVNLAASELHLYS